MARRGPSSLLTALGFTPSVDRLYQRLLPLSGRETAQIAVSMLTTPEDLLARVGPLVEAGVVRLEGPRILVAAPLEAVTALVDEQVRLAAGARERLEGVAAALPFLAAGAARPTADEVDDLRPLEGEISSGGQRALLVQALVAQSKGDLRWLRPDQWRSNREDFMAGVVAGAVAEGRRSMAIYPVRALHEAPEVLAMRAAAGEEVRVLPELPTRLFVIGDTHAVVPEPLGYADEPLSVVRQQGLVEAMAHWFDLLWERAAPVAPADRREPRADLRRFLLQQLAAGAQDEQVARTLGVSLRTVRRRVADIMTELGTDTRFQAGVEAARRGWL
jgi:DNA-binding CsgD family transcriptional regulator